eukprot:TRINITY_DN5703_c0_g1_i1.p1 TRINITY_DN5703_c0_g1~~TRINITY_DN5703_c0_g1_i1.p1  ORF type:complete len:453 (+),score=102.56 TRINITY_DN5703_c0_g1_i1:54-1361(+)
MSSSQKTVSVPQYENRNNIRKKEIRALKATFSSDTKKKVASAKIYFHQYWTDSIAYYKAREQRLSTIREMMDTAENPTQLYENHIMSEKDYLRVMRSRLILRDFDLLAILGKGGFGAVFLANKRDTQETVALKKMKKDRFLMNNDVSKVQRERTVMAHHDSEWLVQLKYSFQDDDNIYLAMEYIPGGDMKNLLDHCGCFPLLSARFYFAEMLLAVQTLHRLGYIHRDLKPDNFVLDSRGHIKLIDFGLSKEGASENLKTLNISKQFNLKPTDVGKRQRRTRRKDKAYSIVGSPEYMAREILLERGYDYRVDYWSLGVILYEMLFGVTPFVGEGVWDTFQRINNFKQYLIIPEEDPEDSIDYNTDITEETDVWDLITNLIADPDQRLGGAETPELGFDFIQRHPFLDGLEWDTIRDITDVPFVPEVFIFLCSYFSD